MPVFVGAAVALAALATLIFGKILWKKTSRSYEVVGLAAYFLTVAFLIMLPVGKIVDGRPLVSGVENSVNLNFDLLRFLRHDVFMNDFLLNIAMLVPFGFLSGLVFRRFWVAALLSLAVALLLETLQLFSVSRVTDINDAVYNFLGALMGAAAGKFVQIPPAK